MILGWGLFNLLEGLINHHALGLHNVVQRAPPEERLLWDLAFLVLGGFGLILLGAWQIQIGEKTIRQPSRLEGEDTVNLAG